MDTIKLKRTTKRILCDTVTPVEAYLKLRDSYQQPLLLESSEYGSAENSQTFICLNPIASLKLDNGRLEIQTGAQCIKREVDGPLAYAKSLREFVGLFEVEGDMDGLDKVFGYNTFEAVRYMEDIQLLESDLEKKIPEVYYAYYSLVLQFDHFHNQLSISHIGETPDDDVINKVLGQLYSSRRPQFGFTSIGEELSNVADERFEEMVHQGIDYCQQGEVFQIVLSRQFTQKYKGDEFNVYRALRSVNPSPYLFYFDYGSYKLMGSSPEAQLVVKNNQAEIHPIAGTFKRTGNREQDLELAHSLQTDPKENAEHVMLVDLARNDLNRHTEGAEVVEYGQIQNFSHVIHMVSKICGKLSDMADSAQVFADTFPAGTLSGAPKYRAMELITKEESTARSFYGGAVGWIGLDGSMNQAIMIRSLLCKSGALFFQAGAGVVIGSNPIKEREEVDNKVAALRKAILKANEL